MRLRWFSFVLALLVPATPVLGVVCQMDCDQVPATSACHESTDSPDGRTLRSAQHACNHDHATGKPARLASAAARDSVGAFVFHVPTLGHSSVPDAGVAIVAMHGPPGPGTCSTSSRITVLRI